MAQQVVVELVDDLDGTEAVETVEFGLDGARYEIDLSEDNASELRDALALYVEHGRRTGGRRRATSPRSPRRNGSAPSALSPREESASIRAWARGQGYEIADRGRISAAIVAAYRASASH
ncbi:nucleoid-associated protein Lsr2 [Prauserella sp. PE36]|uniref:histone-like nucleoid-structuring protein Lsr2 n=1 Tax=Prauserella sp. PE36 TaxID=1504709 RepID=UPI000DE47C31|nr:Lsr2 family protein [Prauserella sp. PE36]RBM22442.1 nucleoid-associated protein Lsr2 [Prauserella sp. PE36]